jgi:hypothetical protein
MVFPIIRSLNLKYEEGLPVDLAYLKITHLLLQLTLECLAQDQCSFIDKILDPTD